MDRDDAFADDVDWLDVSSADGAGGTTPPRRPWPRWLTLAVTGVVVAVVVAVMNVERGDPATAPATPPQRQVSSTQASPTQASPTQASSTQPAPETSAVVTPPSLPAVSVTELGRPLLNTTAGWELFGRGPGVLAKIEPAAGRVTRTAIPDLRSGGPVYLVAGSDRVVVRPLDNVPGYVVADGRPAQQLSPPLNENGPAFPGPSPGQMWVRPADDHQPVLALATLDGKRLAEFIPVPPGSSPVEAIADGAGYLLFQGIGGLYQARPQGLRRVSTGVLLAAGPTGWLVVECDERYRCQTVLVGRAGGLRKTVADRPAGGSTHGVISPDGSTAAMLTSGPNGALGLSLLSFARGSWLRVPGLVASVENFTGSIAFSPDGKWLFAVTADGAIAVVNPRTSAVSTLDVSLPPLTQLLVRPVARPSRHVQPSPGARRISPATAAAQTKACCRPTAAK